MWLAGADRLGSRMATTRTGPAQTLPYKILAGMAALARELEVDELLLSPVRRQEQPMRGTSQAKMEHNGKKLSDRGAAKYVFVTKGKVLEINNSDFAALADHAGHTVKLTGELHQDGKITVSKIEMPKGKKTSSSK
jgi:hypothetical protein